MHMLSTQRYGFVALLSSIVVISLAAGSQTGRQQGLDRGQPSGEVVQLSDLNFDGLTASSQLPWLVAVTASWCSSCQVLKPKWRTLAERLESKIHVAEVDESANPVLLQRFAIKAFPSIYHLSGDETRQYRGPHTVEDIIKFANGGWKAVEALPQINSPVSPAGRILGKLRMIPYNLRMYYRYLHHDRKYSVLTLLVAFLSVPVIFGVLTICLLDALFTRSVQNHHHHVAPPHPHNQ